jgi:hypothetical protein
MSQAVTLQAPYLATTWLRLQLFWVHLGYDLAADGSAACPITAVISGHAPQLGYREMPSAQMLTK